MRFFLLAAPFVLACGGTVFPQPTTDGGATDAAADVPNDTLTCQYGAPATLASEKVCTDSNQCAFVNISISCCQAVAYGVSSTFQDAVATEVAARTASCPGCGCLAQSKDELGKTGNDFNATCDQGKCTAHAK
jgi:hypothetical protein